MGSLTVGEIDYRKHPRVNSADPIPPRPRPSAPAQVVKSDAEAIEIANRLSAQFKPGAGLRDREGLLPLAELDAYSQSGRWGINIASEYGGADVSYATLAKVIEIIAEADPSIAQITQNHLAINCHIGLGIRPRAIARSRG
jgi:alkylation response protein AidB-like acyl-CoA dehydrogenase